MFPSLPHFSPLFHFHVLYWMQTEEVKWGRPGNEANVYIGELDRHSFLPSHSAGNGLTCNKKNNQGSFHNLHHTHPQLRLETWICCKGSWFLMWGQQWLHLASPLWLVWLSLISKNALWNLRKNNKSNHIPRSSKNIPITRSLTEHSGYKITHRT